MKAKSITSLLLCLVAGLAIVGCGQQRRSGKTTDRMAGLTSAALSNVNDENWRCPYEPNVILKSAVGSGNYDYSENDNYAVCVSRDSNKTFKVSPSNVSSSNEQKYVCVYPMYQGASGATSSLQLLEMPRCFEANQGPFEVSFSSNSVNYMVIVDRAYTDQMNACLSGPSSCPPHSEGFVQ